jgi:PadR family transcriptional regulator PadR
MGVSRTVSNIYCVPPTNEAFENLRLELRRGSLILAVMAQLRQEQYGYVLRKSLKDLGIDIDENTLYPLLRRLETQGLLESQWREEDKRKKRFYRLSDAGADVLEELLTEWRGINQAIERIVEHEKLRSEAWN